jgi:hypothetical protein
LFAEILSCYRNYILITRRGLAGRTQPRSLIILFLIRRFFMKMTHLKRATALTLVLTLVLCQGFVTGTPLTKVVSNLNNYVTGASTATALRLPAAAQLLAHGAVTLNGNAVPSSATVFSEGSVKTAENSTAVLSFGQMGQVELTSASDFTLAVEGATLGGQLRAGRATFVVPVGIAVKILTVDGPITTDGTEATVLTVDVTNGKTRVSSSHHLTSVSLPPGIVQDPSPKEVKQDLSPREMATEAKKLLGEAESSHIRVLQLQGEARKAKDVIKLNCVNENLLAVKQLLNIMEAAESKLREAIASGDRDAQVHNYSQIKLAHERSTAARDGAQSCVGDEIVFIGPTKVEVEGPRMPDDPTDPTDDPFSIDVPLEELIWTSVAIIGGAAAGEAAGNNGTQTLSPKQ